MSVQTSAQEFLATLVQCERHVALFPSGMPVRACLRRQAERQRGAKAGTLGPPPKPFCAGQCAQGREIATLAASVGVQAAACPTCGAALIGGVACEVCMDTKAPAKGFLPAGVEKSERIWTETLPDVPFSPPSPGAGFGAARSLCVIAGCGVRLKKPHSTGVCSTCRANGERAPWASAPAERAEKAAERVRAAAPTVAPAAVVQVNQEPARPAREEAMAGKTCSKCGKDLRADNTAGICGDQTGCRARVAAKAGKPTLPPKPGRALKAVEKPRKSVRAGESVPFDLEALGIWEPAQLRVLKAKVDEVLRAKLADLEAETQAVRDALGEAA
jgi:hypothetical protein